MKSFSPTGAGREAESATANALVKLGYEILDQNWRTKFCEIDIVARKDNIIFFVEVKYRSNAEASGDGFDAIGKSKLLQMRRAAEAWATFHKWEGDMRMLAVAANNYSLRIVEIDD